MQAFTVTLDFKPNHLTSVPGASWEVRVNGRKRWGGAGGDVEREARVAREAVAEAVLAIQTGCIVPTPDGWETGA